MPLEILRASRPARHADRTRGAVRCAQEPPESATDPRDTPLGWEVRLLIDAQVGVVQTRVCRSREEVLSTGEEWKAGMGEEGWQ